MIDFFDIVSKENEIDTMRVMYAIESASYEINKLVMEVTEFDDTANSDENINTGSVNYDYKARMEELNRNKYYDYIEPGQEERDFANNLYKTNKIRTKNRFVNFINDVGDNIPVIIKKISDKIRELFNKIKERFFIILNDVKTKASLAQLKLIIKGNEMQKKPVREDVRAQFVEEVCKKFNKDVNKLMASSKNMGPAKLERQFNMIYEKTMNSINKYIGDVPKGKLVSIQKASADVLKEIKDNPGKIDALKETTATFADKVGKILEKDAKVLESPEKRNVCMTIINKVTKVNSDCINFITKHPFVVTAALTSVGVASGLASSAITKHNERKYEEDIFGD